jgi:CHAT domain-containing protein/tetratricopeptide (TPR) repeat protein
MVTMLNAEEFIQSWEQLSTSEELERFLTNHSYAITNETIQQMKAHILQKSYADFNRAFLLAESMIVAARRSDKPLHMVTALIAYGNMLCRQGNFRQGIERYDEAQQIALQIGNELEAARSQIGKVWALGELGEREKAVQVGEAIRPVLENHTEFMALGNLDLNIGNAYYELQEFDKAIRTYQRGMDALSNLSDVPSRGLAAMLKYSISIILSNQDRYQEALLLANEAAETQRELENKVALAVCQYTLGYCNVKLGHFNRALRLLDEAYEIFLENKLQSNITTCNLFKIPCYLALNRFERAAEHSQQVITNLQAEGRGNNVNIGYVYYYLGIALAHLGRYQEALGAFGEARKIFSTVGEGLSAAHPMLEQAEFHYRQANYNEAEALCKNASTIFNSKKMIASAAQCDLLLGKIRLAQLLFEQAQLLAQQALQAGRSGQTPLIVYQALLLQAEIAEKQGKVEQALEFYQTSLEAVEEMRGRVAAEARATFIEDKELVYQGAVALSLEVGNFSQALELVERGKSRALVDLLAGELDIRIKVRAEADRELVAELENWRMRRNELVSRLANASNPLSAGLRSNAIFQEIDVENERSRLINETRECEKQITNLVEKLQVRNADYAEDMLLRPTLPQLDVGCLEDDTVLIEYYICREEILAFVIDRSQVKVVRQLSTAKEVNRALSLLRLNLAGVTHILAEPLSPEQKAERIKAANINAKALLQKLHRQLIAPLANDFIGYRRLIIVPHGPLHYLPFHALCDKASGLYLIEEWEEISYLPSGSLLSFCHKRTLRRAEEGGHGALVMGFSNRGALTYCVNEARRIAELLGQNGNSGDCELYLEEEANERYFNNKAGTKQIIHLATHGQFREDDPLFSALLLSGGELTAQDLFNQQLSASLVTFSACETGLGALRGGDELQGLSRACLYAGASSLLLSLWRVEDESVAGLMENFYSRLLQGARKGKALREAQQTLLHTEGYEHPFFWAPFILIGHSGSL